MTDTVLFGYASRLDTNGVWRISHRVGRDWRMCLLSTSTFPCHRSTPQRAREFCLRFLREVLPGNSAARDVIDGCLLVVSELGTNAVQAGSTMVGISVEVHRDHVRLAADDDGPGLPRPVAIRASDRRGRGLAIVDSLSRAWGVQPQPHGKRVWADVAIPSPVVVAVDCRL
jgi:anti-sigma regulatory factor (Ser/Thr protein kinase)